MKYYHNYRWNRSPYKLAFCFDPRMGFDVEAKSGTPFLRRLYRRSFSLLSSFSKMTYGFKNVDISAGNKRKPGKSQMSSSLRTLDYEGSQGAPCSIRVRDATCQTQARLLTRLSQEAGGWISQAHPLVPCSIKRKSTDNPYPPPIITP